MARSAFGTINPQTALRQKGMRAGLWVLVLSNLTAVAGEEARLNGRTLVTVRKGTVELQNDKGARSVRAGEVGLLKSGQAPEATESAANDPTAQAPAKNLPSSEWLTPIDIRWDAASHALSADGLSIPFSVGPRGWGNGQSPDGRYLAVLSPEGELTVTDGAAGRSAALWPDGSWNHKFGGRTLRIEASGKAVLTLPGGREVRAPSAVFGSEAPRHRWEMGVRLDRTAEGKLLVRAVDSGSPMQKAGLQAGDEILAVGALYHPPLEALRAELMKQPPRAKVKFLVRRGEQTIALEAVSGDWD